METTFGDKLYTIRKQRGWTLADLSKRSGLSISHISSLERGTRSKPSMEVVTRLANSLQIPVFALVEGDLDENLQEADRLLNVYSPELQQFLLMESATPYVHFAKQLHDVMATPDSDISVIETLAEFIRMVKMQSPSDSSK